MRGGVMLVAALAAVGCGDDGAAIVAAPFDMVVAPPADPNPPTLASLHLFIVSIPFLMETDATARFSTYTGDAVGPTTTEDVDGCLLHRQLVDADAGFPATPKRTEVGAGTVTLMGPGVSMPLPVDNQDGSYYLMLPAALSSNAIYTMTATGDAVPPFTISVEAPRQPKMLSPAMPSAGTSLTIDRTAGLTVTWLALFPGTMTVTLTVGDASGLFELDCTEPARSGALTISNKALSKLPTDSSLSLTASVSTTATTTAGDWSIPFVAEADAVDSKSGKLWIMTVTLK